MLEPQEFGNRYVKVKDKDGNIWLCPLEAMKKASEATPEELEDCVEWEVVTHTAGRIDVER